MKKLLFIFTAILISVIGLTSCSNDEPSGGLSGWYASQLPAKGSSDYGGRAYRFVNKNTVEYYPTIAGTPRWDFSEQLSGSMKGYYIQQGVSYSYTYQMDGNKVYIPMQGVILTISGNSLIKDGGGTFTKK